MFPDWTLTIKLEVKLAAREHHTDDATHMQRPLLTAMSNRMESAVQQQRRETITMADEWPSAENNSKR